MSVFVLHQELPLSTVVHELYTVPCKRRYIHLSGIQLLYLVSEGEDTLTSRSDAGVNVDVFNSAGGGHGVMVTVPPLVGHHSST